MRRTSRVIARAITSTVAALAVLAVVPTGAGAQYFGKNKVQYREFEWKVLESDHFDLYFYEGERRIAVDAARIAERAYDRLSAILDHEFEEKIPLIIYASHTDFQSTNVSPGHISEGTQGVTELMKRRVFLPFTGSYSEFVHVLEHELVHAFQLDILLRRSDSVLATSTSYIPPLWWMEGMAEYLSLMEIDEHTEMWLRDAALSGYLVSVTDMAYVGDIRVYRFGQAILAYIGERFGNTKIGEIHKASLRTRSLERAIEDVLGISIERFSEDWTQHVRRTYLPTIADHLKPTEFARRLTNGREDLANFNLAPSVDPEGRRFVFISDRSLYNDIYLASAIDGQVDRRLIKGERTGSFESLRFLYANIGWSPDGRELALVAKDGGEDVIVIFDVERRKEVERIRPDLDGVLSPSFSPDGARIAFNGLSQGYSDVYVVSRDGGAPERLTASRNAARDPVWSPDGKWIAFTTDIGPGTDFDQLRFGDFVIGLYEVASGRVVVPDGQSGKCINPQWSPEGDKILFVSDRSGISNVYAMSLDGSDVRQLTNILSGVTGITSLSPCFSLSRDGSRLVFSAFSGGGFDVFAMDYPLGVPEGDEDAPRPAAWIVDARGLPGEDFGEVSGVEGTTGRGATSDHGSDASAAAVSEPGDADLIADSAPGRVEETGEDVEPLAADVGDSAPSDPTGADADADAAGVSTSTGTDAAGESGSSTSDIVPTADDVFATARADLDDVVEPDRDIYRPFGEGSLPDSSSFNYHDYRLRFSPDFVAANGLFASNIGVAANTAIGFSDVLGNHQFVLGASVYGSLLDADIFLSYANLSRRTNWGVSLFQYRSDFIVETADADGDNDYISQIHRGLEFAISRPFSRFRRLELGVEFLGIEERVFGSTYVSTYGPTTFIDLPGDGGSRFFTRPSAALVSDNVIYGNTGPISGSRSRLEASRAVGGVDFTTFFGDYRTYLNTRQRYVVALRTIAATSFGVNPQTFRIGGPYTLRGYDFGEVRGHNVVLTNLEFRFPLIDYVKLGWPLPIGFQGIRGLMFFDVGAAWDDAEGFKPIGGQEGRSGFYLNDIQASYGFGMRMNVFGFLIARWDIARKTDIKSVRGPWLGRFALGAEF